MTSQRDETTNHAAGDEREDDPIIIERRDEILTGDGPADAGPRYDPATGDDVADGTGHDLGAGDGPRYDQPGSDQAGHGQASGSADEDATGSDELVGRHPVPDTGGMDPAPLVVPPEAPRPDMGSMDTRSMETGRPGLGRPETGVPEAGGPETGGAPSSAPTSGPADPGPAAPDSAPFGSASPDQAAPISAATSSVPAAVVQPGVGETPDPSEPGPASAGDRDPAAGAAGGSIPAAALSEQQWPAIQAMFVDDPKGSVQRAAAAADEVVTAFVASLEREQAALRATWEHDTTTEDLRTALQQYRAFCGRLEGLA